MLFDEADSELLKNWATKKLESIDSDADADVLADYVLALVKTDEPEKLAKANCTENLRDFLNDKADSFVDELFQAIAAKSYDPSKPPPKPRTTAPTYQPPRRASLEPPRAQGAGKKRSYHDWDRDESQNAANNGGDRPVKQARRGGRGGRQQYGQHSLPLPPTPPPGMPAWDPDNPFASLQAMYTAMGMLMPPNFAAAALPPPPANGFGSNPNRCRDYDKKGFCTRGANCPYEHGDDPIVITGDEYDPTNPGFLNVQPIRKGVVSTSPGKSFRGRGNWRGGGKRADFSRMGPNHDKSITSIVVEQIPEDKFDEQTVRDFFGEFGSIVEIQLQPYKRLAVVKYNSYDSAKAAYDSPKVIFDNRFVKVYWYKDEASLPQPSQDQYGSHQQNTDVELKAEEPEIDLEQVAKQQEEAQRRYDEKKQKTKEAQKKKEAFEAEMKALEEKKRKILAKVAEKEGKPIPEESERTKALREQLAKLEAEAVTLGIDPNAASSDWSTSGYNPRGRGAYPSYRARGRGRGRGAYNASFRGGWAANRGGAVKRLDNRPKSLSMAFSEGTYEDHEEAIRSWLLVNDSESTTLVKHPTRPDAALVAFPERYLAENFKASATSPNFPLAGKVELSWHTYSTPTNTSSINSTSNLDTKMETASELNEEQQDARDLDVADEDDRWG